MRTPFMKYAVAGAAALSLIAGGAVVAQAALTKNPAEVTAGTYDLDSGHGKITWSVNHFGLSTYTGQFVNVKAVLKLDPANPSASTLTATIPLTDVAPNDDRLKAHLQTADFFDTAQYPTATFVSRSVTVDADDANEATVVGDLTLKGVTKPVTFKAVFNGEGKDPWGGERAGFNAKTTLNLNDFGIKGPGPTSQTLDLDISLEGVKQK